MVSLLQCMLLQITWCCSHILGHGIAARPEPISNNPCYACAHPRGLLQCCCTKHKLGGTLARVDLSHSRLQACCLLDRP
jgi:hypothetical protein